MQIPRGKNPRLLKFARTMRQQPTDAELTLCNILRMKRLCGYRFRRQHRIGNYILDFYCPAKRLCVELDGGQHTDAYCSAYDERRTFYLSRFGIRVLRFSNIDVLKYRDTVATEILRCLELPPPQPSPGVPGEGEERAT